jgi:preprotein translocase subunit SecF
MITKLLNKEFKIDFLAHSKVFMKISIICVVLSIALIITKGFNKGIDFAGGIIVEVRFEQVADLKSLRSGIAALNLGDVSLQNLGTPNDIIIRVGLEDKKDGNQLKKIEIIKNYLRKTTSASGLEFRRADFVGPTVGNELIRSGFLALFLSFVAILSYVWIRFNYRFGVGALVALIHDVILTLGFYALFQIEFNLTSVAAILTIIGYSINDSVVVYDRIRENCRKYRSRKITEIINRSMNEILNRTFLTSITTMIALIALVLLGGPVLKSFSLGVLFGVFVGTYSSIYIAASFIDDKSKIIK